jgi:hypothetical protein
VYNDEKGTTTISIKIMQERERRRKHEEVGEKNDGLGKK